MTIPLLMATAAVAFAADRSLKVAVASRCQRNQRLVLAGVALTHRRNRSAGLVASPPLRLVGEWLVLAGMLIALLHAVPRAPSPGGAVAVGLLLGGTAGNAVDVWRHAAIVDVIDLGWWPVFNLADAAIVTGVVVGLLAAGGLL